MALTHIYEFPACLYIIFTKPLSYPRLFPPHTIKPSRCTLSFQHICLVSLIIWFAFSPAPFPTSDIVWKEIRSELFGTNATTEQIYPRLLQY